MNIGFQNTLISNVPDPFSSAEEVILTVKSYAVIKSSGNSGISYGGSKFNKLWNYFQVYKFRDVIRKSLSRSFAEKIRNDKWMVVGLGEMQGQDYWFFHPAAQKFQSKVAVSKKWLIPSISSENLSSGWAEFPKGILDEDLEFELGNVFPVFSGNHFSPSPSNLESLIRVARTLPFTPLEQSFPVNKSFNLHEGQKSNSAKRAVLFGFGNYARTITLPYLQPYLQLAKVHEIDPSLFINSKLEGVSTSPFPDQEDFQYPVWLIAGFHHTHAQLAIEAMEKGVIPVIEKPIATTWEDYYQIEKVARKTKTPFFQCFQKRYQIFNDFIKKDLEVSAGDPIHFKATVFEIPLDKYHWYNWPVSGSRIISNGCHWIDHFLFLNDYCDWVSFQVNQLTKEDLIIQIKLENGASGIITLSDTGSNRIGMREYVEFSVPGRRAYIKDSLHYESESNEKIIRSYKTDKLAYLRKMYKEIGVKIHQENSGDDLKTLKSTKLCLEIEDQLKAQNSEYHK
jgi:predicted dehydrogenase